MNPAHGEIFAELCQGIHYSTSVLEGEFDMRLVFELVIAKMASARQARGKPVEFYRDRRPYNTAPKRKHKISY